MNAIKQFYRHKESTVATIVVLLVIGLSLLNSTFLTFDNWSSFLKSNSVLGIAALGTLLVILTGNIDISSSGQIALVTVVIAKFMLAFGGNPFIVFIVGLGTGLLMGTANGLLVAKLKIPSIIATLATNTIINGALRWYTNGAWISGLPEEFTDLGDVMLFASSSGQNGSAGGIPIQLLFLVIAAVITFIVLLYTMFGRGIYAMGGNAESSQRAGFNNDKLTIMSFAYAGLMYGLAGVVYTTIMKTVDSNAFFGFEMNVIGAVVLGGASITGGSGSVIGTMLGMLLMSIIKNGLILTRIPTFWQAIVIGVIILFAVSLDIINLKREEKRTVKVDILKEGEV
jgi:ribose/xylose/arabinose/galactoside ABC-type transport system permease subunit